MSDVLEEAEALLVELPGAVSRRKLGERLGQAVTSLKDAGYQVERIKALLAVADLIKFGGVSDQREAIDEVVECAEDVGAALEMAEDPEALRKATYEYENILKSSILSLDRAIRTRWRTVAEDRFSPLIVLGRLLSSMNVQNDLGERLKACGEKGSSTAIPSQAADLLASIKALFAEYDALQAERAREIADDEVGEFINALADRRATLAMVSPKVHAWLEAHSALDRLGINPR